MSSMISTDAAAISWTPVVESGATLCNDVIVDATAATNDIQTAAATRVGRTDDRMKAGVPALGGHPFGTKQGSPPRGEPR